MASSTSWVISMTSPLRCCASSYANDSEPINDLGYQASMNIWAALISALAFGTPVKLINIAGMALLIGGM
jgi:hypothetical protein